MPRSCRFLLPALVLAPVLAVGAQTQQSQSVRTPTAREELTALESRWNEAHIYADTTTLFGLWDDDVIVIVPEMRPFNKDDLKAVWRSGRSHITRYETSDLTVRGYDNSAVVEGRLTREVSFAGRPVTDYWRFTKIYVKRDGRWRVVSYHASPDPTAK